MRGLPGDLLRRAGSAASGLFQRLIMAVIFALMTVNRGWPRWVPNLARLVRSSGFGELQSGSADWLDRNFELIEQHDPGLNRIGRWTCDRCQTSWRTPGAFQWVSIPRDPPFVSCGRVVTTVYGFDGALHEGLAEIAAALAATGWGESGYGGRWAPLRDLGHRTTSPYHPEPPVCYLEWRPVHGLGAPPGLDLDTMPRRMRDEGWVDMGIGWVSRGQPTRLETSRGSEEPGSRGLAADPESTRRLGWPRDLRTANAIYQPVEIDGTDVDQLTAQALARHQHVLGIRIELSYYPNRRTEHDRLPRRLLPVIITPRGWTLGLAARRKIPRRGHRATVTRALL